MKRTTPVAVLGLVLMTSLAAVWATSTAVPSADDGPGSAPPAPSVSTSTTPATDPTLTPVGGGTSTEPGEDLPPTTPVSLAEPVRVAVEPEPGSSRARVLGPAGGRLSATAGDGTSYTLDLPPGALTSSVRLRMTPLAAVRDLPLRSLVGAVDLMPHDLALSRPATVRVDPPGDLPPVAAQVGIAFGEDGVDAHLLALADGAAPALRVSHLGGVGVAAMSAQDRRYARQHPPRAAWAAFEAAVAPPALARRTARLAGGVPAARTGAGLDRAAARYYDDSLRPRLAAGPTATPAAAMGLTAETIAYVRDREALGLLPDRRTQDAERRLERLLQEQIRRTTGSCAPGTDLVTLSYVSALATHHRLLGYAARDPRTRRLAARCARFHVGVRSTMSDRWDYTSPGETHRLRARWVVGARWTTSTTAPTAPSGRTVELRAARLDLRQRVTADCGAAAPIVSRWTGRKAGGRPGTLAGRLELDANLHVGGIPTGGRRGWLTVRVTALPTEVVRAATYGSCDQAEPDRFETERGDYAQRSAELFGPAPRTVRLPVVGAAVSGPLLLAWSDRAELVEQSLARRLAEVVRVRVEHRPQVS